MKNTTKKHRGKSLSTTFTYLLLGIGALFMLIPFYWMINTALKSVSEIEKMPPTFFPGKLMFSNFLDAFKHAPFGRYMLNSLFVGVVCTLGTLATTILSAFAFSKLEFKGKSFLFMCLLATMMIPGEMMVITNFLTIMKWGWLDTYQAMILPFMVSVFYTFLLRNNFMQIPNELYLSAKVDGTSDIKYLGKVMIPMAKPTIISITILNMLGSWNAYIWPNLVIMNNKYLYLVTNGLRQAFTDSEGATLFNLQMAAAFLVTLPVLIIFLVFKKYIMKGTANTGVKG